MKVVLLLALMFITVFTGYSQSIVGTWQLMQQTSCMDDDLEEDEGTEALVKDMKSMSSRTPRVIQFKENNSGEESIRMLDKRKASGTTSFLYKFNGTSLYILDKKSHTIKSTYEIEKITTDSLIFSNTARACEIRVFARIK